jgi:hypothetical protein
LVDAGIFDYTGYNKPEERTDFSLSEDKFISFIIP